VEGREEKGLKGKGSTKRKGWWRVREVVLWLRASLYTGGRLHHSPRETKKKAGEGQIYWE